MIREQGYTLIELLVVIAIVGLLSSVIILGLNSARVKARNAKRLADVTQLSSAIELYFNQYYAYPSTYASLVPTFMSDLPTYPIPIDDPCVTSTYAYTSAGQSTYQLLFCISAATGGVSTAGTHTLTQSGIQ
jgi:prepilin-type N-terminal cleavage/methylation domain-containing protein